tara:strand:- start:408 stop:578 length:171 start_codon:yes stop_codon:yes gene_type:complete
MSYINTQSMSMPLSNDKEVTVKEYSPMSVKKLTMFNDMEKEELKQMMREVLDEYLQ